MTKRLKAIPTTYRGTRFRSQLEAKYAQAFDRLGIIWVYEHGGFMFDDGTMYCPDFYMPELDTYFEVKGILDDESIYKIKNLAKEEKRVFVGAPNGNVYTGHGIDRGFVRYTDAGVVECAECNRVFFFDPGWVTWSCPACDAWDGDHHMTGYDKNIFRKVGW